MKEKVSLKGLVGTKIVYAGLLVCYYWMWARRDWKSYYDLIQNMIAIFTVLFLALQAVRIYKYGNEKKDGLAMQRLHKIDAIVLKIMVIAVTAIAFASAAVFADGRTAGYGLVGTIFVLTVIRFILFCVMDKKES